ncbi:MAG: HD domain-containing protein [Eubacterium sp.]|nr:HD domain-containing protein [Eubacterium sp.]
MKKKEKKELKQLMNKYLEEPVVQSMKQYVQHGSISTYEHCLKVTEVSFLMNRRLHLKSDEEKLVSAAMLHDFYLYDWHEPSEEHRLHGFFHPHKAAVNAKKYFDLGEKECQAIESHMWPLTLSKIPTSREGWILCLADKYCAFMETFFQR